MRSETPRATRHRLNQQAALGRAISAYVEAVRQEERGLVTRAMVDRRRATVKECTDALVLAAQSEGVTAPWKEPNAFRGAGVEG